VNTWNLFEENLDIYKEQTNETTNIWWRQFLGLDPQSCLSKVADMGNPLDDRLSDFNS
jgi:hypothetical protein